MERDLRKKETVLEWNFNSSISEAAIAVITKALEAVSKQRGFTLLSAIGTPSFSVFIKTTEKEIYC